MREGGLEPPHLTAPDPKSGVSAISPPPHRESATKPMFFGPLAADYPMFLGKHEIFYSVSGFINRLGAYIIRRLVARTTIGRHHI